jgi:hypothetical protein
MATTEDVGVLKAKATLDSVEFDKGMSNLSKKAQIIAQDYIMPRPGSINSPTSKKGISSRPTTSRNTARPRLPPPERRNHAYL